MSDTQITLATAPRTTYPTLTVPDDATGTDPIAALRDQVEESLTRAGAVHIAGAGLDSPESMVDAVRALGLKPRPEQEPLAPRVSHAGPVYSSLAWPTNSGMCMHHDGLLGAEPTPVLVIGCLAARVTGGRTGLADGRLVYDVLPERIRDRAVDSGWTLERRYGDGPVGLHWKDAFGTESRTDLESQALASGASLSWDGNELVARRTLPSIRESADGTPAWVNMLAFASEWTLDPMVRDYLIEVFGREGLPMTTSYGDGSPFPAADVAAVNSAYDSVEVLHEWRSGDLLVIDNLRIAHSREAYTGTREMVVVHAGKAS